MIKKINSLFIFLYLIIDSFAVTVVETTGQASPVQGTSIIAGVTINWNVIVPIVIIGIIVTIFLLIVMWIVKKIVKKIRDSKRAQEDLEFNKFNLELKNAFINKNPQYKKRNPLWLWLLWYRAKVYARTSDGRKMVGYYDGELTKKEGYFIMALQMRHSFFKRETDLVLFPFQLKKHLVFFNIDGSIDLDCEGIDEVLSSKYFSIPVFKDTSDKEKKKIFVDFSDDIRKNYFDKYVYRDVLKENIIEFAENVKEASEMNSSITYQRKTGNDLNNR